MGHVDKKLAADEKLVQQVVDALSGPPSSPNAPANVAAAHAAARAEINQIQAERHALEQAVRNGEKD